MKKTTGSGPARHQVFLSYASKDKQPAQQIARELQRSGVQVWFDDWELKPGDSIAGRIEQALSATDILIVLLSPHSVSSKWVQLELNAALSREITNRGVTVIPAIIADCEIPLLLANRQYIDLRSDFKTGLRRLAQEIGVSPKIDFSRLTPSSFENLVGNLLVALGFTVEREVKAQDKAFDFHATIMQSDPFGASQKEMWFVEAKFYKQERVSVSALAQMIGYLTALPKRHKGLVITNSELTSVAQEYLADIASKSAAELRVIGGTELRRLLLQNPALVERFFPEKVVK